MTCTTCQVAKFRGGLGPLVRGEPQVRTQIWMTPLSMDDSDLYMGASEPAGRAEVFFQTENAELLLSRIAWVTEMKQGH